ncbi:hypothetical protein Rhopal_004078-T1 [Rhodotorula paludigena]|uniref:Uncharacterized protein n=1 Tax=Rhodotorula paludigena TaxID=86838 RepID=A0AAV5GLH8_9BASI|nr:hypothetical protein Rhopal_004078-T1 [Rhodotorula paludigena]
MAPDRAMDSSSSSSLSQSSSRAPTATTTEGTTVKELPEGDPMDGTRAQEEQPVAVKPEALDAAKEQKRRDEEQLSAAQRVWRFVKRAFEFVFIEQWFLVGIGVVIVLAWRFPNVARQGGIIEAEWSIRYLAVGIIFLISGLSIPPRNLYHRALDWKLHLACQITTFLLFPTIVFAIVSAVRAADPEHRRFHEWALVGLIVMGVMPTTVSSNVTMTGQAGGDVAATTVSVILGNTVGTFLTPALLEMFLSSSTWSFGKPVATGGGGIGQVYKRVLEQLGYSVFIPLFVGEVIQKLFTKQVKWAVKTLRLGKVGTFCLLLVIWSTFSGAFYENAFEVLTGEAIALLVTLNVGLYLLFATFLFALCRYIPFPHIARRDGRFVRTGTGPLFSPETTISINFTGAAKGAALGAPIVSVLYGGLSGEARGIVSLPLVLYQGSQVVLGQATVSILRAWNERKKREAAEAEEGRKRDEEARAGRTG